MKRIVLCSDGTWNTPDQVDRGKTRPSNVARVALAVASEGSGARQILFYDEGVGTNWDQRFLGGAFGVGIDKNIEDIYRYLVDHYEPDDDIFLFGFSRGAYTVRSVAGLIRNSGLLKKQYAQKFSEGFRLYRRRDSESHPTAVEATLFRRMYSYEPRIRFIGVWDTVGALGIPLRGMRVFNKLLGLEFHDVKLSSYVDNAFQALAIDERRAPFEPTLWRQQEHAQNQTLEQVWFAGVHTNIGGGYEDTGLSDITFEWMRGKAELCGLAFYRPALNDLSIKPAWDGELRDSKTGLYALTRGVDRPISVRKQDGKTNESVHACALVRYRQDKTYRPPSLTDYIRTHAIDLEVHSC